MSEYLPAEDESFEVASAVPPTTERFDDAPPSSIDGAHLNDVGYCDALVSEFDGRVRYLEERGQWLTFEPSTGWQVGGESAVTSIVADYARRRYQQALRDAATLDPQAGARAIREAVALGCERRIRAALSLARCHRRVAVGIEDVDRDLDAVGVRNGVLRLADGHLEPFSKERLVLGRLGAAFDPSATCPAFDAFLARVQPDEEVLRFLRRLAGYALSGEIREHVLPFHYGVGANGKSTFLEMTLLRLMGTYGGKVSNDLVYSQDSRPPHLEIACIAGKRFLLGEENADGSTLNETWLKSATGGDRQKGRHHHQHFFEYDPTYKLALVGNHHPRINGTDNGIWRRFLLIQWAVTVPKDEQDPSLPARLADDLPGVLNWALAGYQDWAENGLNPPAQCLVATQEFRSASDQLAEFIEDAFETDPQWELPKRVVFDAYLDWAKDEGIRRPLSMRGLAFQLRARGWQESRTSSTRSWVGRKKKGWA